MVKRKTEISHIGRKTNKKTLNNKKRNTVNNKNNDNNNLCLNDSMNIENTFLDAINDFNEKELIKSNSSIEKKENGIIIYTKIDICKNGKKITKKVSMKDNKILSSTEIIENNNNSDINNEIDNEHIMNNFNNNELINNNEPINNNMNNYLDNRFNSNDEENNNLNNNIPNNNNDNNERNMDNSSENNNINIEDLERKFDENVNNLNRFVNNINNSEERINTLINLISDRIYSIRRNNIRNRRNFNRFGFGFRPWIRDRWNRRYRDRYRINEVREERNNNGQENSEILYNDSELDILEQNNFNVENIPDITLENVSELNDENKICSICLEEYKNNDIIKKLPCNHNFHSECVKIWLSNKTTCPVCRTDLRESN